MELFYIGRFGQIKIQNMKQEQLIINIAKQYCETPGAREIEEGHYSGEDFLQKILKPKFEEAVKKNTTLLIDLDETEGYATSFLEEAFGGLARLFSPETVLKTLMFKCLDEPLLDEEIKTYIREANVAA